LLQLGIEVIVGEKKRKWVYNKEKRSDFAVLERYKTRTLEVLGLKDVTDPHRFKVSMLRSEDSNNKRPLTLMSLSSPHVFMLSREAHYSLFHKKKYSFNEMRV